MDLLRCGRAAPQAACKLAYSLAAQLLLIITCAQCRCLNNRAELCRSGGSFSNTANVGARPRSQTEQQMERTASGKTNVIPYSQYRKSRLDSIRNDLGLQGGTLLRAGGCFARSICGHWSSHAQLNRQETSALEYEFRKIEVCANWKANELYVCRGSRTKGEGKRSR